MLVKLHIRAGRLDRAYVYQMQIKPLHWQFAFMIMSAGLSPCWLVCQHVGWPGTMVCQQVVSDGDIQAVYTSKAHHMYIHQGLYLATMT